MRPHIPVKGNTMNTAIDFVALCAGFVPFLALVAIALFVFWIATKCIPSLNEWMTSTDGMAETDAERYDREHAEFVNRSYDTYA
jgi:hypothetical protein